MQMKYLTKILATITLLICGNGSILQATESTATETPIIIDDGNPILTIKNVRIGYHKNVRKTEEDYFYDIKATLSEPGTITSDFETAVTQGKIGVYVVTIQGEDTAGNKSNTVQTIVLVEDEDTLIDVAHNTMMEAYDFNIKLSDLPDADLVALATVNAWRMTTGEVLKVQLDSAKPTTVGVYPMTFSAGETTKMVKLVVEKDSEIINPVLTADKEISYEVGTNKTAEEFLKDVHVKLDKDGTITSDFDVMVNIEKVGVYIVTIKGEDTEGNKSNVVETTVTITDDDESTLPITGALVAETALGGLALVGTSLGILFRKRK